LSYRPAGLHRLEGRYDNPMPDSTLSPNHDQDFGFSSCHLWATCYCWGCLMTDLVYFRYCCCYYRCLMWISLLPVYCCCCRSFMARLVYFRNWCCCWCLTASLVCSGTVAFAAV
jgi:hypothetical protein